MDVAEGELRLSDLAAYDLVHVFNIQTALTGLRDVLAAKEAGKPIVLSPIYWDMRHLERDATKLFPRGWSLMADLLGRLHWRALYTARTLKAAPRRGRVHRAAKQMLALADVLLPNSYAETEVLVWTFNAPSLRQKAFVVPNAADVLPPQPSDRPAGLRLPREYVLEVGRLEPTKGQMALIQALADVPSIPLVFVGRGEETVYGRECVRLGSIRGNTFFLGEIPRHQLGYIYECAKVHALPSLRESPGLATLEAAAHGANCVVSIHGPVLEYFGQDAWYCDPADIRSIRSAVLAAWAAPRTGNLRQKVLTRFTWHRAAEMTLAAYRWLLGSGDSPDDRL